MAAPAPQGRAASQARQAWDRLASWRPDRIQTLSFLLGATLITLLIAFLIKRPCLVEPWDGTQYEKACYNELQPLFYLRGFNLDPIPVPYVESFNEYPVLTGLFQYTMATMSWDANSFFLVNAVGLGLLALATTWALTGFVRDGAVPAPRILLWALGPPLALYAFSNWDLLATFPTVLGLLMFRRNRMAASGVLLGLGAAAKFYPVFFLPILGLAVLRDEGRLGRRSWAFGLGAVGALAATSVPFLFANRDLYLESFTFHAHRVFSFETLWSVLAHYGPQWGHPGWDDFFLSGAFSKWSMAFTLLGVGGLAALAWFRRIEPVAATFGATLVFLLANKFYSVQYGLWVLPFLAMLRVPWWRVGLWLVADYLFFRAFWPLQLHLGESPDVWEPYFRTLSWTIALRTLALLVLLEWVVRPAWQRRTLTAAPAAAERVAETP
ncbi:MAG TPA: glycosyltransferase 87 family protein [Candidatus Thermoplasmatota archaeon]|nr:glycosyltransferase 87 family protein [Candidatus Thermoplasmatota archaeon]